MSIENALAKFGKSIDSFISSIANIFSKKNNTTDVNINKNLKSSFIYSSDIAISVLSMFLTIFLRLGLDITDYSMAYILETLIVFGLVSAAIHLWLQTHQAIVELFKLEDIVQLITAVILSNLVFIPLMVLMNQDDFLPYQIVPINIFTNSILLICPRLLIQSKRLNTHFQISEDALETILFGSIAEVDYFLNDLSANALSQDLDIIGILTHDHTYTGRTIRNVPVFGSINDINHILRELHIEKITIKQIVLIDQNISDQTIAYLEKFSYEHKIKLLRYKRNSVIDDTIY